MLIYGYFFKAEIIIKIMKVEINYSCIHIVHWCLLIFSLAGIEVSHYHSSSLAGLKCHTTTDILSTLCAQAIKVQIIVPSGTLRRSGMSSGMSKSICIPGSRSISTWLGCEGGVPGLGIWWIHRYSWLSRHRLLQTIPGHPQVSCNWRYASSSESTSGMGRDVLSNIRHAVQTPWWTGNLSLCHLGAWRERWDIVLPCSQCRVEGSFSGQDWINTYMASQSELVIHNSLSLSYPSSW